MITFSETQRVVTERELRIRAGVWAACSTLAVFAALWIPDLVAYSGVGAIFLGAWATGGLAGWLTGWIRREREIRAVRDEILATAEALVGSAP